MITLKNIRLLITVATLFLSFSTSWAENNPKPFTIPELKEWKGGKGYFDFTGRTWLAFDASNPGVAEVTSTYASVPAQGSRDIQQHSPELESI